MVLVWRWEGVEGLAAWVLSEQWESMEGPCLTVMQRYKEFLKRPRVYARNLWWYEKARLHVVCGPRL